MLSNKAILRSLRIAIVIGIVFVGAAGFFSTRLFAQDVASSDLTTLSDDDISAYRWQAMADFYTDGSTLVDLTTLSDGDILSYRWQATANFYTDNPTLVDLTTLSDGDILSYRWQAIANFYADQADRAAMATP